mmetsp:Transcript_18675/g.17790  ORF Transcript_18675/g.17790 Transcript_18675/m.17790 type:complete len:293 (+) Transcript_18675:1208-2086(+)
MMRKLVMNVYSPKEALSLNSISRLHINEYPPGSYSMMEYWLSDRVVVGEKYQLPDICNLPEETKGAPQKPKAPFNFCQVNLRLSSAQQGEKVFYSCDYLKNKAFSEPEPTTSQEQAVELMPKVSLMKKIELGKKDKFHGLNLDIIRLPFHQPKSVAKPHKVLNGVPVNYVHPSVCSGIFVIYKMGEDKNLDIEIRANNERDVLSVENVDVEEAMLLDLEVSSPSLDKNIEIRNFSVSKGQKKVRQLQGIITPESNSCFKYFIRSFNWEEMAKKKDEEVNKEELIQKRVQPEP